jgi:hypothetical protein
MAMTKLKERCEIVRLGQTSASRQMPPKKLQTWLFELRHSLDIRIYSFVILAGAAKSPLS